VLLDTRELVICRRLADILKEIRSGQLVKKKILLGAVTISRSGDDAERVGSNDASEPVVFFVGMLKLFSFTRFFTFSSVKDDSSRTTKIG
jgi:hypothetical protein